MNEISRNMKLKYKSDEKETVCLEMILCLSYNLSDVLTVNKTGASILIGEIIL